ncbi:hypothetical protein [Actinomadura macrotermitis]|uniref:Uncharacterized protein n=1 Tax=Actinomadura macrotermitis TaxID=2585200 RepID=A0A7K0C1C5_9ACTN|nr:hypothetical protein [Actinomadura macrotermitis]MQY07247.1 hypothetical protein [Actinomadura macrotermitis]
MTHLDHIRPAVPVLAAEPATGESADITDLLQLQAMDDRGRRITLLTRAVIGVVMLAGIVAVLLDSPLPHHFLLIGGIGLLAVLGAAAVLEQAALWGHVHFALTRSSRGRYHLARRWYAPGTIVLTGPGFDRPAVVLDWLSDPALAQPWVLIHDGDNPAQVVPLNQLAPLPTATGGRR